MEILYADPYYGTEKEGEIDFLAEILGRAEGLDPECTATETDFGLGADFPGVLLELFNSLEWPKVLSVGGLIATFFLGEKIEKNLGAWKRMGLSLVNFFRERQPTFIDETTAALLVIAELDDASENFVKEISVQVISGQSVPHGKGKLGRSPYALYIVNIVQKNSALCIGMSSRGEVLFRHEQGLNWTDF